MSQLSTSQLGTQRPKIGDAQAIIDAAEAATTPAPLDIEHRAYSLVIPAGGRADVIDTEQLSDRPWRAKAIYKPMTVEAFTDLCVRHGGGDEMTIWVHPSNGTLVAVFNDNHSEPEWRDHRAHLTLTPTPEWQHWTSIDSELISQVAFAEHIEDGLTEIVEPTAADMLEVAQSFHAQQAAAFRSATRLDDGTVQMLYDQTIDASAGKSGRLDIPTEFVLAISPWLGEDPYRVRARLRYRLRSGQLHLGYKLDHADRVLRDSLEAIALTLSEKFGDADVFVGMPE